jgi:hypothetical protein
MSQKFRCRHCGDDFIPDKETIMMFQEGYIAPPDTCYECLEQSDTIYPLEEEVRSDADNGL